MPFLDLSNDVWESNFYGHVWEVKHVIEGGKQHIDEVNFHRGGEYYRWKNMEEDYQWEQARDAQWEREYTEREMESKY